MDEISNPKLLELLRHPRGELALLDVREEGVFARGHILLASSLPLSRLETDASRLVPRHSTPIVVCDGSDGLAQTAQSRLRILGYSNVLTLQGGMPAWVKAGNEIFTGLNAPSKALGVFAVKHLAIPEIEPGELAALAEKNADVTIVDCRPYAEYQRGSIPGAFNCPGVELVRQFAGGNADTHIVVTCAGRTRGLLGAQSLIDTGIAGRITALHKGTMGWELSGRTLEKKANRKLQKGQNDRAAALEAAANIRARAGIFLIDKATLDGWLSEKERTTYLFDIRERGEFEAGHLAQARHVAGGQLVQNLDQHVATQGAQIVLYDDDGVRATGTALWLRRMGWSDVAVVTTANAGELDIGSERAQRPALPQGVRYIEPEELRKKMDDSGVLLVDLASSRTYRAGHIPGAYFAIRSRLAETLGAFSQASTLVLTSEDGVLAAFSARDDSKFEGEVFALSGGTEAWKKAGFPLSDSKDRFADEPDDVMLKPSELSEGREEAMREYLSGSDELLEKVGRDASLRLSVLPVT